MLRGAFWVAGGRVVANLTGFASALVLARLLVPADYGLVAIASTVLTIVLPLTELQLSASLIYDAR